MRKVSQRVREQLEAEPDVCARRKGGGCGGRITWEHAVIFAGKQVDEPWAIIKLCERHHGVGQYQDGGILNKQRNLHIALNRATDDELRAVSKAIDYIALRDRLNIEYGEI